MRSIALLYLRPCVLHLGTEGLHPKRSGISAICQSDQITASLTTQSITMESSVPFLNKCDGFLMALICVGPSLLFFTFCAPTGGG